MASTAVTAAPRRETFDDRAHVGVWAALAAIPIGMGLGVLGMVLLTPGGSLLGPALEVLGVGLAIAISTGLAIAVPIRSRLHRLLPFSFMVGILTVAAATWTFEFSLPASVEWSNATSTAQHIFAVLTHGANPKVVPAHPCTTVQRGSVGPLRAPYRECPVWTPEGHFIVFSALTATPEQGIAFTNTGAATFPDECSRHLIGQWWMFTEENDGLGDCPIGYTFHGGG
jgi:hypothetical protein